MKIGIFTEYFEHDKNSAGRHMSDLVRELSKSSETIDVFTLYKYTNSSSFDDLNNVQIHSLNVDTKAKNKSLIKRFFIELSISFRALLVILRIRKLSYFDVLIWYSPTIFWAPIIKLLNFFKKAHKYLILRDIFPQWAVDLQVLKKNSLQYKVLRSFESLQYRTSDVIAIQTEGNRSHFDKMPSISKKIRILRTWYDSNSLDINLPNMISEQIPKNKKVLLYAGNLGLAQDQELLLKIINKMQDQDEFVFLLVGLKDSDRNSVKNYSDIQGLKNLIILDSLDHKYMDALCRRCFLGIFSLDKRHTTHNIPGKFLQYLSSGLPVFGLCGQGDIVNLINQKGFGRTYLGNKDDEAVEIIKDLSKDIENGIIDSKVLKRYIKEELSTKYAVRDIRQSITR
tara:strand:- start:5483 stop:6673 length:1191 start_codon:yes stop_codon:yes gene_type:complete